MEAMRRPVVAHYRERYLGASETFIHETVSRHRRYAPVVITHARVNEEEFSLPGPLHVERERREGSLAAALHWSAVLRIRARGRTLRRVLAPLRPDVLHAHFGEEGVVAASAARSLGVPLVVTFYGFDATQLARHYLWRRRFRGLSTHAQFVLAEGPRMRERLIALGFPPDRTRIHPIPIRLELFDFNPPRPPQGGRFVLLQACRFAEKKGVDLTIRAFAGVAPEWPAAELWLLGDGPERGALERLAAHSGAGGRIRFLGMRSHEEYAGVLRQAHVFVHPSRTAHNGDSEGGAPTALLEAQALGLPVIASDHADIPFVVAGDAALLAPEGDAEAVAAHMRHLLNHPEEWPARARAGRAAIERRHDPVCLGERLEAIYDEAIAEQRRGRGPQPTRRSGRGPEPEERVACAEPTGRDGPPLSPEDPLVSVVIPTRNRAGLLPRAIRSVLEQTFGDLELLVIDDGSTDDTPAVLASHATVDARVRTCRLERGGGAPAARNVGIVLARGRYVAFLDDDDEWLPEKLERQVQLLDGSPDVGAVLCPYVYEDAQGGERIAGALDVSGRGVRRALFEGNFGTSCLIARREALAEIGGFDEQLPRLQDLDLFLRLAPVTRFGFVPVPLVRVRRSGGVDHITSDGEALRSACEVVVVKLERADMSRAERAEGYYALGHALIARGLLFDGRRLLGRSLRLRPWPPQRLAMALLAALGRRPYAAAARVHAASTMWLRRRRLRRIAGGAWDATADVRQFRVTVKELG